MRIRIQGPAAIRRHGETEDRFVGVWCAVIRPSICIIVLCDVLAVLVDGIALRSFANKIQPTVNTRFPEYSVPILPYFVPLKQSPLSSMGKFIPAAVKSPPPAKYAQNSFKSP